jgi:putative membrane protein
LEQGLGGPALRRSTITIVDGTGMMSMMIFMFLFGLLLISFLVLIGIAIVKWLGTSKMPFSANTRENALEILKTRYAKGEIGRDEFETIKRDIEK